MSSVSSFLVIARVEHQLGTINSDFEEFEEAQKHLQSAFKTYKAVLGVTDEETMCAHMAAGMAARMAGNLQDAKEILEESVPKGYYKYARFAMVAEQNEKTQGHYGLGPGLLRLYYGKL